jgi:hypothetical protein
MALFTTLLGTLTPIYAYFTSTLLIRGRPHAIDEFSNNEDESSSRVTTALVGLEPCAGKLACTVLRGLGTGNRSWLLDPVMNGLELIEKANIVSPETD